MEKQQIWSSFIDNKNKNERRRIELTGAITNRMLRFGIPCDKKYEQDIELLEKIYSGMAKNAVLKNGFEAFKIFVPKVPGEIFNRYEAIRHELRQLDLDTIIVGACGLSPVGLLAARENPKTNVYDTDLSEVVEYRRALQIPAPERYTLMELDLLNTENNDLSKIQKGKNVAIVVEGLVFYLDEEKRKQFNRNLQKIAEKVSSGDVTYVFDVYVADQPSRIRDTVVNPEHPQWKDFMNLVSNVYEGQKAFFKTRQEAIDFLRSEGYKNPRVSSQSRQDSAHTIFVCEYDIGARLYDRINEILSADIPTKKH